MTAPPSEPNAAVLPAADTMPPVALQSDPAADVARGIAYMAISIALFALMDGLVKWLSPRYPVMQIVFFRSLFAFVPLAIFIFRTGTLGSLVTRRPFGHIFRSLMGLAAMSAFFYAFANMPLANAVAISFAAPLFITALSVPLLGEAVGRRRWSAVVVGFLGVIVMVRPDAGVFDRVALVALAGSIFMALAMIFVRKLSKTETSAAIVFYFSLSATAVSAAFLPGQWVTPDVPDLALLITIGLIGGMAQIVMTNAFRHAPVAVIAPFEYTAMLWAVLLGIFVWGDVPGLNVWLGVAIVAASGIYIVQREANLGLRRGIARRLQPKR